MAESSLPESENRGGRRLHVFSIKTGPNGSVWVRAGTAWYNRDGSINIYLDVLPLDGKLHLREPAE